MRKKILTKEEALLKKKNASFVKKIIRILTIVLLFICAKKIVSVISTWVKYISEELYFLSIIMWYGVFLVAYMIIIYLIIKTPKKSKNYSSQKRK